MFGISFTEITVIALVLLIVVGPQKLPAMLLTAGRFLRKLRTLTSQVRAQTGIDELLRQEGLDGGITEFRSLLRGDIAMGRERRGYEEEDADPYREVYDLDRFREYPPEGPDSYGAIADDLVDDAREGGKSA